MLNTLVAFSIFVAVATESGVKTMPYVPQGQVTTTQYQTEKACKKDLSELQDKLKDTAKKRYEDQGDDGDASYELELRQIKSMRCKQVDVTAPTVKAPQVSAEPAARPEVRQPTQIGRTDANNYVSVWKIGRMDAAGVFRGTQYNTATYVNENACLIGMDYAMGQVVESSQRLGTNGQSAVSMLEQFRSQYSCVELTVDAVQAQQMISKPMVRHGGDNYAPGMGAPSPVPGIPQDNAQGVVYDLNKVYVTPVPTQRSPLPVVPGVIRPQSSGILNIRAPIGRNTPIQAIGQFGYRY